MPGQKHYLFPLYVYFMKLTKTALTLLLTIFTSIQALLVPQTCIGQEDPEYRLIGFRFADPEQKSVSFPFELNNNLVIITVIINNAIPLRFVLDTGVRTAILTDRTFTDFLRVDYDRTLSMVGADGIEVIEALVARDISLRLPGIIGTGQSVLVLQEDYLLMSKMLGSDVHGIIGYELFSRFIIDIDYENKIITFHDPNEFKAPRRFTEVDLSIEDTKPYMRGTIVLRDSSKINSKLMIDTGASHTMILNLGSHPDISLPPTILPGSLGRGLGGNILGAFGRINTFSFEDFCFEEAIISFANEENFTEIYRNTGRQGSLGGGIMTRFHVIFDYVHEKAYFRKNRQYHRPFEYNMAGLEVSALEPYYDRIFVQEVAPGSAAYEAGVLQGDEILLINGRHAPALGINAINNLFRSKVHKRIKMRVRRGTETLNLEFELARIL